MYCAKGRLVFEEEVDGRDKPLHNTLVALVYVSPVGTEMVCTQGHDGAPAMTDLQGNFDIWFKPSLFTMREVHVRVFSREPHYAQNGQPRKRTRAAILYRTVDDFTQPEEGILDFGVNRVAYWEYDRTGTRPTPRLRCDEEHPLAQKHRFGRQLLKYADRASLMVRINPVTFPLLKPVNRITKMKQALKDGIAGARDPDSDEFLVDLALNGFNPCAFKKAADGRLYVDFNWQGLMQDGVHDAPNTTAYFVREGGVCPDTCTLRLDSISVTKRSVRPGNFLVSGDSEMDRPQTYRPTDGEIWGRVKRIWRNNYFLWGEVFTHLAATHLNAEQYIIPFERNVQKSAVRRLLAPPFYGCVVVNVDADKLILGDSGLLVHTSALTARSAGCGVREGFHQYNWHDWTPRAPQCKNHTFARLSQLYWEVTTKFVDIFFEENQTDIEENWVEIKLWSDEIVRNAVPYAAPEEGWLDSSEVNKPTSPHPTVNGRTACVTPITTDTALNAGNRAGNIENLKQVCRYLIFTCTFLHGYVNDRQFDIGGDPDWTSLGLRKDITDLAVRPQDALTSFDKRCHVVITDILQNTKYGYIMKDEDGDVHPALKALLEEKRGQFMRLGMPIETIRSCINI